MVDPGGTKTPMRSLPILTWGLGGRLLLYRMYVVLMKLVHRMEGG